MKKLLSILGAVGLTATGASVAVSCGTNNKGEDKEVVTTGVQALLDAAVKDKVFESDAKAIEALKAVKLTTGLVLDGEPTAKGSETKEEAETTEKTFTVKVKADKGYKLAKDSLTSFEVKASVTTGTVTPEDTEVVTTGVQALLDEAVKDKVFESDAKAIEALKAVKLTTGLVLDGEPTAKGSETKEEAETTEKTFTVKVKADKGYKLATDSLTSFDVIANVKKAIQQ
ncbi:lipoprotein [Mesoplasma entomophilum]|uniref:Uncharacterized protein n=1 Tax=Mesoplasma entomophilum TaxID=2149 RepID=A0A3S5Y0H7_9MOLU|nr:lipoprotein [Mesoplasma entomophilum]ATQ35621.1 hypothetical protein CS528_02510 [Mesoplasma entomophilum]